MDFEFAKYWLTKGLDLGIKGSHVDALQCFDKALAIDPESEWAWIYRGMALDALGKYEEAIKAYDRAIDLNPKWSWPLEKKGLALEKLGRRGEAVNVYIQLTDLDANLVHSDDRGSSSRPKDAELERTALFSKAREPEIE